MNKIIVLVKIVSHLRISKMNVIVAIIHLLFLSIHNFCIKKLSTLKSKYAYRAINQTSYDIRVISKSYFIDPQRLII